MLKINFNNEVSIKAFIFIALQFLICFSVLAETFSVRCKFSDGQVTDFDKSLPNTKRTSDMSDLVYDQIDTNKNSARLIGNIGVETVRAIAGSNSVHLIEITGSGNMNIATIFGTNKLNSNSFPVVHSRHMMTSSGALPSQYLGLCTKLF